MTLSMLVALMFAAFITALFFSASGDKKRTKDIEAFAGKFVLFIPGYLSAVKYLKEFIEEGEQICSLMLQ